MAQARTYEGTPAELVEKLLELPDALTYRITVTLDDHMAEEHAGLEAAITRMWSRTPKEIEATRERILAATPPPRELPEGKSLFEVIMGTWPGDETDEEITAALEKLS